jgi:hypothetical protein
MGTRIRGWFVYMRDENKFCEVLIIISVLMFSML